jgi:hypothetical protein
MQPFLEGFYARKVFIEACGNGTTKGATQWEEELIVI